MPASAFPTGTVTFVFTDIEGSTRLVQDLGEQWLEILEVHNRILSESLAAHGGVIIRTEGDAFFAVFSTAGDAVAAAIDIQRALTAHEWPPSAEIKVRIGMHTGQGELGGDDYVGLDVHRAARIAAAAHGGQIVCSETTAALIEHGLADGIALRDLGKHRLKDLTEREAIFQLVVEDLPDMFPPLNSLERVVHNLPVQMTSFVGREAEIAEAARLLERSRLVTLLGPGGTGKSRLSLQVAAECAERFADGAYFVPLAPVTDAELVPSAILGAAGVPASTRSLAPRQHLIDFFSQRSVLLVLDNFEQILPAGEVVAELVRCSPGSRVLVTSRVPLRVAGEQEMPVAPLAVANWTPNMGLDALAELPAVRLFMDRARAVKPDFELTDANAATVAELVRRLDGLPLAIELVVSQLRMLPVEAVLERLDPSRLGGASRDAPERHQTLWNAISWSVEDLDPSHRELLADLSVFVGGGRLEEVERTRGNTEVDVVDGLGVLIEHSLLLPGNGDDVRFRWLRVIREYAIGLLDESGRRAGVEEAHARAYCELAEEASRLILTNDRRRWIEALDRDHDNMRSAIAWAIDHGDSDLANRLVWAMWRFWQTRGHIHEASRVMERVQAMEGGSAPARAKAIEAAGGIAWWQGDLERADDLYRTAVELQREIGDESEIANALYNHGLTQAYGTDDPAQALPLFAEAEEIYRRLGDVGGLANVHWGQGSMAYLGQGDFDESKRLLEQAVTEYGSAGNVFGEGWAHFELGALLSRFGLDDEAEPHLVAGLEALWESRDYSAVVMFVAMFAVVAYRRGDMDRAMRLSGAAHALRDHSGVEIMSIEVNRVSGLTEEDMAALEGALAEAYTAGRAMSYDDAVAYALGE